MGAREHFPDVLRSQYLYHYFIVVNDQLSLDQLAYDLLS